MAERRIKKGTMLAVGGTYAFWAGSSNNYFTTDQVLRINDKTRSSDMIGLRMYLVRKQ